jgi:hypothetical protein
MVIRIIFSVVVILHGLIHLMGFVKAFRLAEIKEIKQEISKPMGLVWLLATLLTVGAGAVFLAGQAWWWLLAAPALLVSQAVIFLSWREAKYGTIANLILLAGGVLWVGGWWVF